MRPVSMEIKVDVQEMFDLLPFKDKQEFVKDNVAICSSSYIAQQAANYCYIVEVMSYFSKEEIEGWLKVFAEDFGYTKK